MNPYIQKLLSHLSDRTPEAYALSGEDLLQQLWYYYIEETSADPQEIRAAFREVDDALQSLPAKEADRVWDVTCKLCFLYQRTAFLDGVTLVAQLRTALERVAHP